MDDDFDNIPDMVHGHLSMGVRLFGVLFLGSIAALLGVFWYGVIMWLVS